MLKLIKFELIHSYRSFSLVFGIFLVACFIAPFLPYNISSILVSLIMMAVFGIVISIYVTIIRNYNTSMFKKPGYLTLTLPVSTHELIISKIVAAMIWMFAAFLVLALGVTIIMVTIVSMQNTNFSIADLFSDLVYVMRYIDYKLLFELIVSLLLQGITSVLGAFALVTLIQTKYTRNHKTVIGFLIFILYLFIASLISDALVSVVHVQSLYMAWGVLILQIILFYFITIFIIDNKIEVE